MDGPRDELFSGTGLPLDQDRESGFSHLLDLLDHLLDLWAETDEPHERAALA